MSKAIALIHSLLSVPRSATRGDEGVATVIIIVIVVAWAKKVTATTYVGSSAERVASPTQRVASPAERVVSPTQRVASPAERVAFVSFRTRVSNSAI